MLVETLIQNTLEMQGFRVAEVTFVNGRLEAKIVPDRRYAPCCGVCGQRAAYRDTRPVRRFRHVPLWGIAVYLFCTPRRVNCKHCGGIHVEALTMEHRQAAVHGGSYGNPGHLGSSLDMAASRGPFSLRLEHGGDSSR